MRRLGRRTRRIRRSTPPTPIATSSYGVLTQLRGLASYTIPKVDVQVSGVMQSKPGALLAANYALPATQVAAALGRPVAGNPANVTVNLLEPGTQYGDRVNQLDFRAAKVLRVRRQARDDRHGHLQHAQLGRRALVQQHVRAERDVAAAGVGVDGKDGALQRGIHVLVPVIRALCVRRRPTCYAKALVHGFAPDLQSRAVPPEQSTECFG